MIPRECKRLAEIDFPIAEVSRHAVREKSIRHGHPSTLHLWWARRPLASCRAILLALLLPDPCDPYCPELFKESAREILRPVPGDIGNSDEQLRAALLRFISDFANWDHAANQTFLEVGRELVRAAYSDERPLVVDPFAGGGSIPLEALRLGCETFASDLNPVAYLILKAMLEDIPRHGAALADKLRQAGADIGVTLRERLAQVYPRSPIIPAEIDKQPLLLIKVENGKAVGFVTVFDIRRHLQEHQSEYTHFVRITPAEAHGPTALFAVLGRAAAMKRDDSDWLNRIGAKPLAIKWEVPIAYIWARTVRCEAPNCGAEIPLVRSFWLCKKAGRRRAFRPRLIQSGSDAPRVEFEIFVPASEADVQMPFAVGGKARCPACNSVLAGERVRAQLTAQRGGGSPQFGDGGIRSGGAMLIAVVTKADGSEGRGYREPSVWDYRGCFRATQMPDPKPPTERINPVRPSPNARGLSAVTRYGMTTFGDLYSRRQLVTLNAFAREVSRRADQGVLELLGLAIGRVANAWTSLCRWHQTRENVEGAFNGQKLPMVWDFAETVPFSGATGGWEGAVEWVAGVVERTAVLLRPGQVMQADAATAILPDASAAVWFTDPPYYDSVPYADLADFFLVWLRRALPTLKVSDPYNPENPLSPKIQECVWNQGYVDEKGRPKTSTFFEEKFSEAASVGRRSLADDGISCVMFAHKSTEGWEALLTGLTAGGFVITASWPIATEMAQRTNARGTASLMGSVHLVCRPRPDDALIGDWADVLHELPRRVREWMVRLDREGVRGADLVFACIGPALEIFSRYSRVETPDGREVPLAEYLEKVWEVVGREALHQVLGTAEAQVHNGGAGALEEDARLTALFLWTLRSTDGQVKAREASILETARIHDLGKNTDAWQQRARREAGVPDEVEEEGDEADNDDEENGGRKPATGFALIYDIVRRFAQPLGIHLDAWEGRIIETDKDVVRLLPVAERARQLFGAEGAAGLADRIERAPGSALQLELFPEPPEPARSQPRGRRKRFAVAAAAPRDPTTLDRVHTAMLLQASGRANALRALLAAEQQRGPDFLRLAQALIPLYPQGCEERRLLEAMLLAVPR